MYEHRTVDSIRNLVRNRIFCTYSIQVKISDSQVPNSDPFHNPMKFSNQYNFTLSIDRGFRGQFLSNDFNVESSEVWQKNKNLFCEKIDPFSVSNICGYICRTCL